MAYSDKEIDAMDNSEIRSELKYLVKATQQNTEALGKLTEISIRREERDSRQEEINATQHEWNKKQMDTNNEIFTRINTIEIERAKEENGRNFFQKHYPYIAVGVTLLIATAVYAVPRLLS